MLRQDNQDKTDRKWSQCAQDKAKLTYSRTFWINVVQRNSRKKARYRNLLLKYRGTYSYLHIFYLKPSLKLKLINYPYILS